MATLLRVVELGQMVSVAGHVNIDDGNARLEIRARTNPSGSEDVGPRLTLVGSTEAESRVRGQGQAAWCEVDGLLIDRDHVEVVDVRTESFNHVDFFTPQATRRVDLGVDWPSTPVPHPTAAEQRLGDLLSDGTLVSRTIVKNSNGGEIVVIAASDPALVSTELRAAYGDHLLMFASPWSRRDYERAHRHLCDNFESWNVHVLGDAFDTSQLQSRIVAAVERMTSDIAAWYRDQPTGMVELRPWIRPAGGPHA